MNFWHLKQQVFTFYIILILFLVITLVDGYRWTSMVPQCQCLLAPLILVVLDTSLLYDILVKLCFKLHAALPEDVLTGHRQRFLASYKKLKDFYESATSLQYFKYLVSIPTLPAVSLLR